MKRGGRTSLSGRPPSLLAAYITLPGRARSQVAITLVSRELNSYLLLNTGKITVFVVASFQGHIGDLEPGAGGGGMGALQEGREKSLTDQMGPHSSKQSQHMNMEMYSKTKGKRVF